MAESGNSGFLGGGRAVVVGTGLGEGGGRGFGTVARQGDGAGGLGRDWLDGLD